MILCDSGPLIALIDTLEIENHRRCRTVIASIRGPLVTTWPCVTEIMYFLGERGGLPLQRILWRYVESGNLLILGHDDHEIKRMSELMEVYHDLPMDVADASLVAVAETRKLRQIFTLDSHFYAYRIDGTTPFEVLPA